MYIFKEAFKANRLSIIIALLAMIMCGLTGNIAGAVIGLALVACEIKAGIQEFTLNQYRGAKK